MKSYPRNLILIFVTLPGLLYGQGRNVISLNNNWEFSRDSLFSTAQHVDLPHDYQIEQPWVEPSADEQADNSDAAANVKSRLSARGFKEMGCGWYRKIITKNNLETKGKRILLDFEGIMLVGDIFLNGQHIGSTDYGYVGFEIDITEKLKDGDNVLTVKTSTMKENNSRWYTGGGLVRNVSLVMTPRDLYFERHPLRISTHDNKYVNITAELCNNTKSNSVAVSVRLYAPNGLMVSEHTDTTKRITPTRTYETQLSEVEIAKPLLWNTETPYLYKAVVSLLRADGSIADEVTEEFGIRTIEISPEYGLKLNGNKLLLKGFANHHTLGALGAANYPRAIEKMLLKMKEFGINHVRTSHNPYSREFIRLCDKLGLLVVDELYDKWTQQYSGGRVPFLQHWTQDITEWVKRDRNSPSIVLWSLGNELQQATGQPFNDFGVTCYKLMRTMIQRYDTTRLTTVAMHPRYRNWQTDSLPCDLAMHTDVQSYNYRYMYFPGDGRKFPWMTFYQSEASISKMGENFFGMDLNKVIGLAYWGAIDYLGESHGWPAKGSDLGVFDITLEPKPKAYLMKSLFSQDSMVHIAIIEKDSGNDMWNGEQTSLQKLSENWNRQAGSIISLFTYTNCEEIELLLNGKSLGRKSNLLSSKKRNQILWENIPYEQGTLKAIGYNQGTPVASHQIETFGTPVKIVAEPDNNHWKADGMDLQHVKLTAVDSKGRRVLSADDELTFEVDGNASIIAVTNGNIASNESYVGNRRSLWHGQAMVILRAGQTPSNITLKTSCNKFKIITTKLKTQ